MGEEALNAERKVLANLEEAGEETVSSLLNTCVTCCGSSREPEWLRAVLTGLMDKGYIEIADRRDPSSRRWIPLPVSTSRSILSELTALMTWSVADRSWKWTSKRAPVAYVLLTDKGQDAARAFLRQHGWPHTDDSDGER